jgi:hypothetical protein
MKAGKWLVVCVIALSPVMSVAVCAQGAAAISSGSEADGLTPVEKAYLEFEHTARESAGKPGRTSALARVYAERVRPFQSSEKLATLSRRDLDAALRAASSMAYYDPTPERVVDLRMDFAEVERRGKATPDQIMAVYEALYQARQFSEMAAFKNAHADADLPAPIASTAPIDLAARHTVLIVDDAHTVTPRAASLERGVNIVVISNPGCHFTQWAIEAIEQDPNMKALFAAHSTWVAPPDRNIDLAPFVAWSEKHPEAKIGLAGSEVGWPEVDVWQTPVFLYFKNGALVDEVVGWPREGNAAAVKAAWAKICNKSCSGGALPR